MSLIFSTKCNSFENPEIHFMQKDGTSLGLMMKMLMELMHS